MLCLEHTHGLRVFEPLGEGKDQHGIQPVDRSAVIAQQRRRLAQRRPVHQETDRPHHVRMRGRQFERAVQGDHVLEVGEPFQQRAQIVGREGAFEHSPSGLSRVVQPAFGLQHQDLRLQPRLGGRFTNRLLTLAHTLRAGILGLPQWKSMRQYFAFDRVYGELRKKTPSPLTDELTLFAVDSSTRGLGIGKTLYRVYLDHLRSLGRSDFYLYTDSLCTFQFYEKQGMTRTASEDMNLVLAGQHEALGVYLYSGTAT